ncbi:hypothetical protein BN14_08724 [Rhizoctonia solani AG-1 IB]|uniref:Uncharacterized protein n=1 Tax=Thanatephorus cucumeris (strain AG1-IB / isolate 7/3/14) TaxID=1108050 RepID=M5C6C9_THACB|nr:hypothetical protein BN14_08724 [Rhizoctonia solani AG-1 IB]
MARFLNNIQCRGLKLIGQAACGFHLTDEQLGECVKDVCYDGSNLDVSVDWIGRGIIFLPNNDYEELGTHPLGFFKLFINKTDSALLFHNDYDDLVLKNPRTVRAAVRKVRATRAQLQNKVDSVTGRVPYDLTKAHEWSTITNLTIEKLNKVVGKKRPASQQAVMYGHSATEVADIFDWDGIDPKTGLPRPMPGGMKHRAEWLHRSAFSFGGLGLKELRIGSSQQVKNLIFGSVEANTTMIRPETTMKRLSLKINENLGSKYEAVLGMITTSLEPVVNNERRSILPGTNSAYG